MGYQRQSMTSTDILSGAWTNGHDSEMIIKASHGLIIGTYKSGVSREGGPLEAKYFSGGYSETDYGLLVTFYALWQYTDEDGNEKKSCTSWAGQIWFDNLNQIDTTWILVSAMEEKDSWRSVLTNKDTFTKME